jgi:CRP-like cAMP-binding protein
MRQEFLKALGAFGPPTAEALAAIDALLVRRRLRTGELWQRAGETSRHLAYVCSGLLRMFYSRADGKEFNKAFIRGGSWVGAVDALALGEPSRVGIQALAPTLLLTLPYEGFEKLCDTDLYFGRVGRKLLEHVYIAKLRREASLLLDSAEDRYRQFLREFADIEQEIPDYQIASYLGITPVGLSRIKKRLNLRGMRAANTD